MPRRHQATAPKCPARQKPSHVQSFVGEAFVARTPNRVIAPHAIARQRTILKRVAMRRQFVNQRYLVAELGSERGKRTARRWQKPTSAGG